MKARFEQQRLGAFFCIQRMGSTASHDIYHAKYLGGKHPPFDKPIERGSDVVVRVTRHLGDEALPRRMWFAKEVTMLSNLDSNYWLPIITRGEESGYHYAVTPYEQGIDLNSFMRELKSHDLELRETISMYLWEHIIRALNVLHSHISPEGIRQPIVMEDLTPGHILVRRNGEVVFLRLEAASHRLAFEEPIAFGERDMLVAPEQHGSQRVTPATDIYAAGCIGYWLFTHGRRLPDYYDGDLLEWPPGADVHSNLKHIIRKCVEVEPMRRPLHASVLVDQLADFKYDHQYAQAQLVEVMDYAL